MIRRALAMLGLAAIVILLVTVIVTLMGLETGLLR